jgi:hypothetical protein
VKKTIVSGIVALALAACGGGSSSSSTSTLAAAAGDDPRARCERFVQKAMQLGTTEAESTFEEKVAFCLEQAPPASLLDCVERAQTKEEAEACN